MAPRPRIDADKSYQPEQSHGHAAGRSPHKPQSKKKHVTARPASPPQTLDQEIFDLNVTDSSLSDSSRGRRSTRPNAVPESIPDQTSGTRAPMRGRDQGVSPAHASNADSTASTSKTQDIDYFFLRADKKVPGSKSVCLKCREAYNANPSINPAKNKPVFEYAATTGITGLRAHLEKNHKQDYLDICKEKAWPIMLPNIIKATSAAAKAEEDARNADTQPLFSLQELHTKLVSFIVADDQSLNVVECPEFRALLLLLREDLRDKDIPRRTQLRSLVVKAWRIYFQRLKTDLHAALGKISFTGDIWSDQCLRPFFAITAHWIARNGATSHLELRVALIAFHRIVGKHDGKNLAKIALSMLDRAGITVKTGHWTLDNAENNATFMHELEILLEARDITFNALDNRIMCFPHIINIASQHVIEAFTNVNLSGLEHEYTSSFPPNHPERRQYEALRARDAVALGRDIVRILRASGQRRDDFETIIRVGNENSWFQDAERQPIRLRHLQLLRDVKTRWDSVYYMIRRLRELRPAIDLYLSSPAQKDLESYKLNDTEWQAMLDCEVILAIPHRVQQVMSQEKNPVLAGAIPAFEMFMTSWEKLGERNNRLKRWTNLGLKWAMKYYERMDNTKAYVVAMFLNPSIRLSWIKAHWDDDYIEDAIRKIKDLMMEYTDDEQTMPPDTRASTPSKGGFETLARQYGLDDMDLGGPTAQSSNQSVDDEFNSYANGILSPLGTDILKFWENYESSHRRLFLMSMDYLPIQASAVPCERIFSSSAETDTKRRNRIKPELMEALQMLKCALKKDRLDFTAGWATSEQSMSDAFPTTGGDLLAELLGGNIEGDSTVLSVICDDDDE